MITGVFTQIDESDVRLAGLEDGGKTILRCSNCRKGLMEVWVTRPNEPHTWKVKCNCPYCEASPSTAKLGGSYPIEIKGGFANGGYAEPKENPEEEVPLTYVDSFEVVDDTFVFTVRK